MAKYMFVFRGGAFVTPGLSPAELQAHLQKWHEWVGSLMKEGKTHPGGSPLQSTGATLRGKNLAVTDGPYAESKDLVTGNLIVEAESLVQATEMARGCPVFEFDGSVEVRPHAEM